jgi:hypothetical protein
MVSSYGSRVVAVGVAVFFFASSLGANAEQIVPEAAPEPRLVEEQAIVEVVIEPQPPPQIPQAVSLDGNLDEPSLDAQTPLFLGDTVAQWIVAVSGLLALGLSAWAVWLLRATVIATRDAVEKAAIGANAAIRSIEVAERATATAARQLHETIGLGRKQLRAYVSVAEATVERDVTSERFSVLITFKNYGQTPARKVLIRKGIDIRAADKVGGDFLEERPVADEVPIVTGPGDGFIARVSITVSGDTWEPLLVEENQIVAYGICEYEDIFGEIHQTAFNLCIAEFGSDRRRVIPAGRFNFAT